MPDIILWPPSPSLPSEVTCTHIQNVHGEAGVPSAQTEHVLHPKQLSFVVRVTLDTLEVAAGILCSYGNIVQLLEASRATFPPVKYRIQSAL